MLSRLRITQRLSLLLVLPLGAMTLTSLPFVVERVDAARAAAATVDAAQHTQVVGEVVQVLQTERLLAVAYLASPRVDRGPLVAAMASAREVGARAGEELPTGIGQALATAIAELGDVREQVLAREVVPVDAYEVYRHAVSDVLDTLQLTDLASADATGIRQLDAFDSLLRLNEQSSQTAAALVVASADPVAARPLAATAASLAELHRSRFLRSADPQHAALLALVGGGDSARRVEELVATVDNEDLSPDAITIDEALSTVQSSTAIRQTAQDRIVRDIMTGADERATAARTAVVVISLVAAGLLVLVIWLGIAVRRSVARPLRRVTLAASMVAELATRELVRATDDESIDEQPTKLAAVNLRTNDEAGELAAAFNRVQATAALLMEQQVTTRRNSALMFANIAHRTRSIVNRQLVQIDQLERQEHDEERLEKLYTLDHLTARLRRSAESLLVISGTREDVRMATPTRLGELVRSAVAEIEFYQNVVLRDVRDVVITPVLVPDLTLLLAELLENATALSPPGVPVEVNTELGSGCVIRVVDRGIGLSPERIAEENQRFLSRERLDVAPSQQLGLFVVGRLARRHGLTVRLEPTPGTGVTAVVTVPPSLLAMDGGGSRRSEEPAPARALPTPAPPAPVSTPPPAAPVSTPAPAAPMSTPAPAAAAWLPSVRAVPSGAGDQGSVSLTGDFGWFGDAFPSPVTSTGQPDLPPLPTGATGRDEPPAAPLRGGLRRRQPGASLPEFGVEASPAPPSGMVVRDPEAERAGIDAFARGVARVAERPEPGAAVPAVPPQSPQPQIRKGLPRRRPGENLDPSVRLDARRADRPARSASPAGGVRSADFAPAREAVRDAAAESAAVRDLFAGFRRADNGDDPDRDKHWSGT